MAWLVPSASLGCFDILGLSCMWACRATSAASLCCCSVSIGLSYGLYMLHCLSSAFLELLELYIQLRLLAKNMTTGHFNFLA